MVSVNRTLTCLAFGLQSTPHDLSRRDLAGRAFDFGAYHTRYVALELAYLGWGYQGFASQADTNNTIEVRTLCCSQRFFLTEATANRSGCPASMLWVTLQAPPRLAVQTGPESLRLKAHSSTRAPRILLPGRPQGNQLGIGLRCPTSKIRHVSCAAPCNSPATSARNPRNHAQKNV